MQPYFTLAHLEYAIIRNTQKVSLKSAQLYDEKGDTIVQCPSNHVPNRFTNVCEEYASVSTKKVSVGMCRAGYYMKGNQCTECASGVALCDSTSAPLQCKPGFDPQYSNGLLASCKQCDAAKEVWDPITLRCYPAAKAVATANPSN